MLHCSPFLLFDGNCAEAMTFYHSCLGGDLTITRLGDSPMKNQLPLEKHNRTINAHLKSDAIEISASDWMASPASEPLPGNTFAIFVTGDDYDEVNTAFARLTVQAAKEGFQELHDLPIGKYGQFTDQFGVHWIFLKPVENVE